MRIFIIVGCIFYSALVVAAAPDEHQLYPCNTENAAHKIPIRKGILLVCYFGSAPEKKGDGWTYVAGASFYRMVPNSKAKPEFIAQSDELGLGVDYKIGKERFDMINYIDTYPGFVAKPFYVETVQLDKVPASHKFKLIYKPSSVAKADAVKAAESLQISESIYRKHYQEQWPDWIYRKIFVLRDFGLTNPEFALSELSKMESCWWNDGELAEVFESIKSDMSTIVRLKLYENKKSE